MLLESPENSKVSGDLAKADVNGWGRSQSPGKGSCWPYVRK